MFVKKLLSFLVIILITMTSLNAQSLQETLGNITGDASKGYLSPISSAFGANLNSGWVTRAPSSKMYGVDIDFRLVVMGTLFGDNAKTFSSSGKFRFDNAQADQLVAGISNAAARAAVKAEILNTDFTVSISGPTIVGSKKDSIKVNFPGATIQGENVGAMTFVLPVGGFLEDLPALPLAAPQFTIGTVYGTSVSFRFLPSIEINKDLGEFKYFGFGLQHNVGQWIPTPIPLDVSVGFFTQTMEVGKIFKSTATTFGAYASKSFSVIRPYAGLVFESSSIDINYDVEYDTPGGGTTKSSVKFTLDGENSFRFLLGTALELGFFSLNADVNFSTYTSISGGLGFAF